MPDKNFQVKNMRLVADPNGAIFIAPWSPPKYYIWDPIPDISTYELALCTPILSLPDNFLREAAVEKLPEEARRHFKVEEENFVKNVNIYKDGSWGNIW